MTAPSEALVVAIRLARELERAGIPYLLGGSVASMLHGEPRATLDIDFVVQMVPDQALRLARAIAGDFHVVPEALIEASRELTSANVIHKQPFLKVDLHVRPAQGHHREEMQRATRVQVGDREEDALRVATAEDVVLQKLRWYRLGGEVSDRQWRDVLGVLKRQARTLDRPYLERWARELSVEDLLARALRDAKVS